MSGISQNCFMKFRSAVVDEKMIDKGQDWSENLHSSLWLRWGVLPDIKISVQDAFAYLSQRNFHIPNSLYMIFYCFPINYLLKIFLFWPAIFSKDKKCRLEISMELHTKGDKHNLKNCKKYSSFTQYVELGLHMFICCIS